MAENTLVWGNDVEEKDCELKNAEEKMNSDWTILAACVSQGKPRI